MVLLIFALAFYPRVTRRSTGSPSDVAYADGSVAVPISSGAELAVLSTASARVISELRQGGYSFSVTKRPNRTFEIRVGGVTVQVLGTEFVIERLQQESRTCSGPERTRSRFMAQSNGGVDRRAGRRIPTAVE